MEEKETDNKYNYLLLVKEVSSEPSDKFTRLYPCYENQGDCGTCQ